MDLTVEQLWERGLRLYEMRQYGDAEVALRAALDLSPRSAILHSYLSLCLCQRGELAEAERSARRAVRFEPSCPGSHYALGVVSLHSDKPRLALEALERCIALDPKNQQALVLTAQVLLHTEQWEPALARAVEALSLDEDAVGAVEAYAVAQRALGDLEAAEGMLSRFLARHPDALEVQEQLGWVALDQQNWAVALDSFQRSGATEGVLETLRRQLPLYAWLVRVPRWLPWLALYAAFGLCYLYPFLALPLLGLGFFFVCLRPACNAVLWWRRAPLGPLERWECVTCAVFALLALTGVYSGRACVSGLLLMTGMGCHVGRVVAWSLSFAMVALAWGSLWSDGLWECFEIALFPVILLLGWIRTSQ
jgi:Tfp pilus assembly protein PilF